LVEPQSGPFERLVENYGDLDGLTFVNAAVDRENGSRTLYVVQDECGEPIEALAPLGTFSERRIQDWHQQDGMRSAPDSRIGSVPVTCLTFEDVLADASSVDLLHIDAEGYDLELLKLFDFERITPPVVRFEHVHLSRSDWDEAVRLLARYGYRVLREEYDTTAYSGFSVQP
jgi:FkbM family methyltransferase